MQLTLDSAVLSRAMSRAKRTVATGDTIPILTTALLEANGIRVFAESDIDALAELLG